MKKNFLFSLMVFMTLCAGFSSCSKDDDDNSNETSGNIVGKWNMISATLDGVPLTIDPKEFLEIKPDGTSLEYNTGNYMVGTWKQANGKLELFYDDEKTYKLYPKQGYITFLPVSYTIVKLDSKNLTLKTTLLGFEGVSNFTRE